MTADRLVITAVADLAQFADQVEPVLAANSSRCSVIATLLAQNLSAPRPADTWMVISDDEQVVGAALATRELNVLITPLPPHLSGPATVRLAHFVHEHEIPIHAVQAQDGDTANFARAWRQLADVEAGPEHAEGIYDIRQRPAVPQNVTGSARIARESDVPGLSVWMAEFLAEADTGAGPGDPEAMIRRRMQFGWKFVWQDGGELVSMAGVTRPAAGVSRVGAVYTPPRFRGHGYASALVATATRQGFTAGATAVMLYTDLGNPTSNKIYQAMGYRRIGNASVITFDRPG